MFVSAQNMPASYNIMDDVIFTMEDGVDGAQGEKGEAGADGQDGDSSNAVMTTVALSAGILSLLGNAALFQLLFKKKLPV